MRSNPSLHLRAGSSEAKADKLPIQVRIGAAAGQKFKVITGFDDSPAIHDQYEIGIPDRTEAVSDDQAGPALEKLGKSLLDAHFGDGVYNNTYS